MDIEVKINTDNAAFTGEPFSKELERVLMQAHHKVRTMSMLAHPSTLEDKQYLLDSNGNTIGLVSIKRTKI